jgi:uncharacterized membrane protein YraQ (UPF0718 family)
MHTLLEILNQSWLLVLQASPYLLFGFVLAGLLHALLPTDKLVRWLGKPDWRSVFNAAAIGTPLPLCSCSVVPVADTLRKGGASKGATTAFLISTPESGVDSISVTYGLLDPIMTIARPIAAMLTAFAAGIAQNLWGGKDSPETDHCRAPVPAATSCCSEATPEPAPSCCCSSEASTSRGDAENSGAQREALLPRLAGGLRYGLVSMFEDLAKYFVVGFLIAGVLAVVLNEYDPARRALHSGWAPLVMLIAGIPMYVCASAATPMVAVLIAQGLSPGAALVFLLAGPATNAASLVVLRRILGQRALVIYVAAIVICALALGYAVDGVYALSGVVPRALEKMHDDHAGFDWLHWVAAVVLTALILNGLWRHYRGRWAPGPGGRSSR